MKGIYEHLFNLLQYSLFFDTGVVFIVIALLQLGIIRAKVV